MPEISELKETAKKKIDQLVNRFDEQKEFYLKSNYNETLARQDFINPFFKALGWDMDNANGYAESYREVIHEDRVKVGGANKAPDYSFRLIGGKRLFFVEAKKPSVYIKDQVEPAFQVRRYGWSAKLPISIVTDFQEFAVYDCTKKPNLTDKASTARIKYLTYTAYLDDFDFIWNTFSRERVLQGSFDKYVASDRFKKGTTTLDNEFLQSLDSWREQLAKGISKANRYLNEDEINYVVQQTIDRIIFLRIAEDRSVEPYGNLQNCIKNGNMYQNLFDLFGRADEKYNSGLFDFNKDRISANIELDNKVLKGIINDLYYPAPYQFSVMPVEILGTAYEQFLGKQIRIDKSHNVKIEQKPEVRKAGGVYYTPQYIVDYIVKNTVGKLVEGKTPKEISHVRIVDPACGSGSFLLGAFEYLLTYHKDYYTKNGKIAKGSKSDTLTPEGNLTTNEKKRILLNNIYGVDVDVNAVEVTKLSLLIKCMEGETEASIATQMALFHDRVLPTLDNNIKSGNSLIDTDYYDTDPDSRDEKRIRPFNWKKSFPEVFKQGGFDAVIGNPPYVKEYTDRESFEHVKLSHLRKYYQGKMDLWYFFACYGIDILNPGGLLGIIVPNNWTTNAGASILRNKIIDEVKIIALIDFGNYMVFNEASIQTMIMVLQNSKSDNYHFDYRRIDNPKPNIINTYSVLSNEQDEGIVRLKPNIKADELRDKFLLFSSNDKAEILSKISAGGNFSLDKKKEVAQGIVAPQDFLNKKGVKILQDTERKGTGIFVLKESEKKAAGFSKKESELLKPFYTTDQLKRHYGSKKNTDWIIYTDSSFKKRTTIEQFPGIKKHLDKFKKVITSDNGPYGLHRSREERFFKGEKIVSLRKCLVPTFTYTDFDCYVAQTFYVIQSKRINMKYLTGLLNSKLIAFWLKNRGKMQGSNYQVDKEPLLALPLYSPVESENKWLEQVINSVDLILQINSGIEEEKLSDRIEEMKQRLEHYERKINEAVYQLYDLSEKEIEVIESGN